MIRENFERDIVREYLVESIPKHYDAFVKGDVHLHAPVVFLRRLFDQSGFTYRSVDTFVGAEYCGMKIVPDETIIGFYIKVA